MQIRFTHPEWLVLWPLAWGWVIWLAWKTDLQVAQWRRWTALGLRMAVVLALVLALAGLQWMRPQEGVNVYFLLDRSDSVPSAQQEAARGYVNQAVAAKRRGDRAGVLVFGSEASLESMAHEIVDLQQITAVVGTERTDMGAAIRLGTAALPETGQKRLVLLSDGNENVGDAVAAVLAARPLGVSVDVVPLGMARGNDASVRRLEVPTRVKKGQGFEVKIFAESDQAQPAKVRIYRNEQPIGEDQIELAPGKNLYTFGQTLTEPGFYSYSIFLEAAGDSLPQNNQAAAFTTVQGEPRALLVSSDPAADAHLAEALRASGLEVEVREVERMPGDLAELQSFEVVFLSNVAAGDLGGNGMRLLEGAVRDFGVGLVCVGGDQAYAAGGYRGTPLEEALPVQMELDSRKVLPSGAVVLIMHGMEFMNGNQVARDCALGVLDALGPDDELGVVLWDGSERWLFPLRKVGDKLEVGRQIAGMNQGDLPTFQNVMAMAHEGLRKSTANLKHILVFSDGDPGAPSLELMQSIVRDRITVSTVMIAGHFGPQTMEWIAANGGGRFYNVTDAGQLPQIFIKEAAVILKSAIFEEPFQPQVAANSELIRGIGAGEYPVLKGYVCTTPKARAETPLLTSQGDPLLAHWQHGLGRAVAFTSDAKAKWAVDWLGWPNYRRFWGQVGQWGLRRLENADLAVEVAVEGGEGQVSVEAIDQQGNYRNFLNLRAVVASPEGDRQVVLLEQTGPGHYEARFQTKDVGLYMLNLMELREGKLEGSLAVGASVNYSPEFNATAPNLPLLRRLAELGAGKVLDPADRRDNAFLHDRKRTYQPRDLWEWLLKLAVILFPLDVGVRRIQLDREEWLRATQSLRRLLFFWRGKPRPVEADESLAALLATRQHVRSRQGVAGGPRPELFQPAETGTRARPVVEAGLEEKPRAASAPATSGPAREEGGRESTASRLLEAKRRAKKRR